MRASLDSDYCCLFSLASQNIESCLFGVLVLCLHIILATKMSSYESDNDKYDSLDLTTNTIPDTPGKSLDLHAARSQTMPYTKPEDEMEVDKSESQPTPAQRAQTSQKRAKITLSERAKSMVWSELGKIKQVRTTLSKAHFLAQDLKSARTNNKVLPSYSVLKNTPQLPGGELSWAFKSEWESILNDCSSKLMDLSANYLLTEKVPALEKVATELANKATTDFERALPTGDKTKGLELFNIVDLSMKKVKRVSKGRVTKPRTKSGNTKPPAKTIKGKPKKKTQTTRQLKFN
jgi:hypothetical protein